MKNTNPKTKGEIIDVKDIYKNMVRPTRQIIRNVWSELYDKIHLPNQREEEIERIRNIKLRQETMAEE